MWSHKFVIIIYHFLYSDILCSQADSPHSHVILHEWISFYSAFLNSHQSGVLTALAWLVPHETAAISAHSVYTIQPWTMHHVTSCKATCIRKVYVCLAITCHLHFWQNDKGLLHATTVTQGWNGYRNKSQHRKMTLENKILPPLLQGFEPATFRSRVRHYNHWAIPAPNQFSWLPWKVPSLRISKTVLLIHWACR